MVAIFSEVNPSSRPDSQSPLLGSVWHVRLLGALEARNGDITLRHFFSRPIAALLARLTLQPQRQHAREELIELLWPGAPIDVGRNRLRNAISSLRRLLEPPGSAPGGVLIADRRGLQLVPGTTRCDAIEFERSLRERRFDEARRWYAGELLPGFYDDWVQDERARLASLFERLDAAPAPGAVSSLPPPLLPSLPRSLAHAPTVYPPPAHPLPVSPMPPAPAWRALPVYLTGYFGREAERTQAAEQIGAHRLVTLTGMGGSGKTRLAVEVAGAVTGFDLIAFVPLADCLVGSQGVARLRVALQLPPGGDSLDAVVLSLAGRRSLLVLDNCEQMAVGDALELVGTLLQRVPPLHLLVTSRRALGYPGERELLLAPLPPPDPADGLRQVSRNPSVSLFIDRARSVRPDFQITERNREALASLCCALEGLPLAIELAASRSRAFTLKDMHAALSQRFSLLARPGTRAGGKALRHDSLHATIAWSWQLLEPRQQRFLVALSVFRGGWSAASAAAVCDEPDAASLLEALTADSLLRADTTDDGTMRFGMLEMIRVFVCEQLDAAEPSRRRRRHRLHFLSLASPDSATGSKTIDTAELPNVEEALRSSVDDGEPGFALKLGLVLRGHWERNGIGPDALALLDSALGSVAPADHADWVDACTMTALLSLSAGNVASANRLVEAAIEHSPPASISRAAALCARVRVASESQRHGTGLQRLLDEATDIARQTGAVAVEAECLSLHSMLTLRLKLGAAKADRSANEARRLYQSIGFEREASALLYERTMCLLESGALGEALAQARTFEGESLALGDRQRQLKAINQQGVILATMRRWADAVGAYGRCVRLAWEMHNHYWLTFALWNHCRNLARLRDPERAAVLMAFSEHYWTTHFGELAAEDRRFVRQVRRLVRCQIGADRLDALWREGLKLPMAQAVRLALPQAS